MPKSARASTRRALVIMLVSLSCLGAWQLVGSFGLVNPLVMATPSQIVGALLDEPAQLAFAFGVTAFTIIVTVVITWSIGVAVGLWIGMGGFRSEAFSPILSSLFAIPLVIWYPLFVAWFGIGIASKVAFGFFGGFFPIALSSIAGARMLEAHYVQYCVSIGTTRTQMFTKVLLPLAFPSIASGLRIGTAVIVVSVIFGEMVAATDGLGYWISYYRSLLETPHVYAGIALSLLCVAAVDMSLRRIEARFQPWQ